MVIYGDFVCANVLCRACDDVQESVSFRKTTECKRKEQRKAKAVDPSIAKKANELINTYVHYFPAVEDIFFNGFEVGQDFTFDECWINETTKVRAAKTN